MKNIISVTLLLLIFGCNEQPVNSHTADHTINAYNVGFLITDGVYNTELIAPYDIFHHTKFRNGIKPMHVFTLSNTNDYVTTFEGLKILPKYNFHSDSFPNLDVLVIPSAEGHLNKDLNNASLIKWIRETAKNTSWVTTHCDGSFMLAKTGLLDGHAATTFPEDIQKFDTMFKEVEVIDSVDFVHDGKYITSSGGVRSYEASLYLIQLLYGNEVAQQIAEGLVIRWDLASTKHFIKK